MAAKKPLSRRPPAKPGSISVGGEVYVATVLRIFDRDKIGRPKQCMLMHEDDVVRVDGGEEFMIVYALRRVLDGGN